MSLQPPARPSPRCRVSGRLYADKHSSESSLTAFSRQVFYFLNNGGGATTLFIASFGGLFIYRPLTWLWSLLIALSLYIHAQLSVQSELTEIDSELNGIPGWTDDAVVLNSKLATLESAEALCGRASQKIKPIIFLSISLLVLGLLFVIIGLSYYGPTMLPWAFGAAVEEQENILIAAWRAGTPAVLLSAGLLLIWSIYQRSKLSSMVAYIRGASRSNWPIWLRHVNAARPETQRRTRSSLRWAYSCRRLSRSRASWVGRPEGLSWLDWPWRADLFREFSAQL